MVRLTFQQLAVLNALQDLQTNENKACVPCVRAARARACVCRVCVCECVLACACACVTHVRV